MERLCGVEDRARRAQPARPRSARTQAGADAGRQGRPRHDPTPARCASADRGIHDPRQCGGGGNARRKASAAHLPRPRRADDREAQQSRRIPGLGRHQARQGTSAEAVAIQWHSGEGKRHRQRKPRQRDGAEEPSPGRICGGELRPFRPASAALCAFHLADPALCRSHRTPRADPRAWRSAATVCPIWSWTRSRKSPPAFQWPSAAPWRPSARRPIDSSPSGSPTGSGRPSTGRISGVTRAGLFVKLAESGADGFIPAATLGADYFRYEEGLHALIGNRTGETHRLGDLVEVKLVEAAPFAGALRFELLSEGRSGVPGAIRQQAGESRTATLSRLAPDARRATICRAKANRKKRGPTMSAMRSAISAWRAIEFPAAPTRNRWQAIKRGFRMRCPNCGEGKLFRAYLKVERYLPGLRRGIVPSARRRRAALSDDSGGRPYRRRADARRRGDQRHAADLDPRDHLAHLDHRSQPLSPAALQRCLDRLPMGAAHARLRNRAVAAWSASSERALTDDVSVADGPPCARRRAADAGGNPDPDRPFGPGAQGSDGPPSPGPCLHAGQICFSGRPRRAARPSHGNRRRPCRRSSKKSC